MIAFSPLSEVPVSWRKADKIVDAPTPGCCAIQLLNGKYLSPQPNGTLAEADAIGPFETAKPTGRMLAYGQYQDYGHPETVNVITVVDL